ncbi:MAG TPA: ATP-binding cassette domain-containing protein, partial [Hyphomicrobiales bacterium]|nr:ATP-binding cassette domain-containing protein [Hyphomicrobiales bacterium]
RHAEYVRKSRRTAAGRIGATLSAFTPLTAEGEREKRIDWSFAPLAEAVHAEHSQSRALAVIDNAFILAGLLLGFSVILVAWFAGLRGAELLPAGFLAFSWIAFSDHAHALSVICLGRVRAQTARKNLAVDDGASTDDDCQVGSGVSVKILNIVDLPLAAPDGRLLGGQVSVEVRAGQPVVISGPSGCGKSTLLKTIAGWLEDGSEGKILFDGSNAVASTRRRSIHLGLHDAAVLYDTVRENLFAPDLPDDELWKALDAVELTERIRQAGGLDAWIAQTDLSLGETHRLALARAWLSRLPIIALDEPEAHLDEEQATRIMDRLHEHYQDRILIYTSHSGKLSGKQRRLTISYAD